MIPVVIYPDQLLAEWLDEIQATKAMIASGGQPVFDTVDVLFAKLCEE